MTNTTIKPCPFCGHAPTVRPWHGGAPTKVMIACRNPQEYQDDGACGVGPQVTGETFEEALSWWNMRRKKPSNAPIDKDRKIEN